MRLGRTHLLFFKELKHLAGLLALEQSVQGSHGNTVLHVTNLFNLKDFCKGKKKKEGLMIEKHL